MRGRVVQTTDLGHYQRVVVETSDAIKLVAFVSKSDPLPDGECTITPRRVLFYVDERQAGVSEDVAAVRS